MLTTREAAQLLERQDNILILTHRRPDGDTIGCAAGLCAALRLRGKEAYILSNPDVTAVNAVYAAPYWAPEGYEPSFGRRPISPGSAWPSTTTPPSRGSARPSV